MAHMGCSVGVVLFFGPFIYLAQVLYNTSFGNVIALLSLLAAAIGGVLGMRAGDYISSSLWERQERAAEEARYAYVGRLAVGHSLWVEAWGGTGQLMVPGHLAQILAGLPVSHPPDDPT